MPKSLPKMFSLIATLLVIAISSSVALAQPRRPTTSMSPADILRVASVGDAQISPNGQSFVYTVSTVEGNETITTLWLARIGPTLVNVPTETVRPTEQGRPTTAWPDVRFAPTPLLPSGWNASNPRWSPDSSKIAFLNERNAQRSVWVVNLEYREPAREREPRFIAD